MALPPFSSFRLEEVILLYLTSEVERKRNEGTLGMFRAVWISSKYVGSWARTSGALEPSALPMSYPWKNESLTVAIFSSWITREQKGLVSWLCGLCSLLDKALLAQKSSVADNQNLTPKAWKYILKWLISIFLSEGRLFHKYVNGLFRCVVNISIFLNCLIHLYFLNS